MEVNACVEDVSHEIKQKTAEPHIANSMSLFVEKEGRVFYLRCSSDDRWRYKLVTLRPPHHSTSSESGSGSDACSHSDSESETRIDLNPAVDVGSEPSFYEAYLRVHVCAIASVVAVSGAATCAGSALAVECRSLEDLRLVWNLRDYLHLATIGDDLFWIVGLAVSPLAAKMSRVAVSEKYELCSRNPFVQESVVMEVGALRAWVTKEFDKLGLLKEVQDC